MKLHYACRIQCLQIYCLEGILFIFISLHFKGRISMFLDRSVSYGHVNFIGTRVNCKGALNTGRNYCSFLFRKREIKAAFNTVFDETGG